MVKSTNKYDVSDYTKTWLVREIARRQRFTISDVELILDEMSNILHDVVADRKSLTFTGLFRMHVTDVSSYEGWDNIHKKHVTVEASNKVTFRPSRTISRCAKRGARDDYEEDN